MRTNKLKQRLREGLPAFGVSVMFPSPHVVEMIARLGFDWVLIDCEHGSISRESLELMVIAAEANGITAIGRPATSSPESILEVLETGAMGVQVPHVSSAATAEAVVQAARFFPQGQRGLAKGTRPANYGFGLPMENYVERANEEILVCIQIEEEEALTNLDQIVQVEGIDVFFVGPSDLSQSLKRPGRADTVELQGALERVFGTVGRAGKTSGCAGGLNAIRGYLDQGVRYIYTHFTSLLSAASQEFLDAARDHKLQT